MHEIIIALIVGPIIGILSVLWVNVAFKRKQERLHQEIRASACAERDKQLQDAKAKGDFDTWNHNK